MIVSLGIERLPTGVLSESGARRATLERVSCSEPERSEVSAAGTKVHNE